MKPYMNSSCLVSFKRFFLLCAMDLSHLGLSLARYVFSAMLACGVSCVYDCVCVRCLCAIVIALAFLPAVFGLGPATFSGLPFEWLALFVFLLIVCLMILHAVALVCCLLLPVVAICCLFLFISLFFFCFTPRHFLLRLLCLLCIIFGSIERNSVQFIELWKRWASQVKQQQQVLPASSSSSVYRDSDQLQLRFQFPVAFASFLSFSTISINFCFWFYFFFFRVPFTSFDCKVFYYAIPTDWLTVGAHYNNRN